MTQTTATSNNSELWHHPLRGMGAGIGDASFMYSHDDEIIDNTGLLEENRPSRAASILVREVVQNFWDSCSERRKLAKDGIVSGAPATLEFRFIELKGQDAIDFHKNLGINELQHYVKKGSANSDADQTGFNKLKDVFEEITRPNRSVKILQIIESGSAGMHGSWAPNKVCKLHSATMRPGGSDNVEGAGGSWGFGKMGAIRSSRINTLLYYTAHSHAINPNDNATQRFLAVSAWGAFKDGEMVHTGWGYQKPIAENGDALPLTDGDAQEAAKRFSIPTRNPDIPEEIGSTICVIEPDVNPEDVKEAVERWWWPAITWGELGEGPELTISVTDYDQEDLEIKPREHAVIGSIITAYEKFRNETQQNNNVFRKHRTKKGTEGDIEGITTGDVYLSSSTRWNNPDNAVIDIDSTTGDEIRHESFVAMVRAHGMVSHYWNPHTTVTDSPFVRGVFIAHPEDANTLLGGIEGPLHHKWRTETQTNNPKPGNYLAGVTQRSIRNYVNALRRDAAPKENDNDKPKTAGIGLTEGLYIGGAAGTGKPRTVAGKPPVKRRAFSILGERRTARKVGKSKVASQLTSEFEKYREDQDDQKVELSFKWVFSEDGERTKKTHPLILVSPPTGDWEVIQPGNEPSSKGDYELLLEGTLGSGRFNVIVETEPMESKAARPGTIVPSYKFIDDEESDIEGGR